MRSGATEDPARRAEEAGRSDEAGRPEAGGSEEASRPAAPARAVDAGRSEEASRAEEAGRPAAPARRVPTAIIKRIVILGAAAVGLYVVWPSLAAVFSAGPQLRRVNPLWGLPIAAAEIASFTCMWALIRLALDVREWFPIATAQLASNAFSRIVPGGAAAGGAVQFDMLAQAGIKPVRAASSVTAVSLLSTATLLGLPVLSIPVILLTGAPVDRSLLRVGSIALGVCVAAIAGGAVLLFADRPLEWVGSVVQRARNRLYRHRTPLHDLASRLVDERDLVRGVLGAGWWKALIYAAGNWLLDLTALLLALAAVGAQPRASVVLLAYVVAAFLGMIPITPGGLGFVEAGLTATLGLAGIGAEQALLATLIYRLASYWMPLPAGAVAYALAARRYGRKPSGGEADGGGRRLDRAAAAVDKMSRRQHGMPAHHARPAVAHDLSHPLPHRRLVAVRRAGRAGGLGVAVAALRQPEAGVLEQGGAVVAQLVGAARLAGACRPERRGIVMVAAVHADHHDERALLAAHAARFTLAHDPSVPGERAGRP